MQPKPIAEILTPLRPRFRRGKELIENLLQRGTQKSRQGVILRHQPEEGNMSGIRSISTSTTAAVLLMSLWACRTQAALIPVLPTDYRVGPIPIVYQPFDFTAYPYTPGSIPEITDGSLATFTQLQGLDN